MDAQLTILDEIGSRLQNISITNGYRVDIEPEVIERARLTPFKNGDLPAINYWPSPDTLTEKTGQMETREISLNIEIYDKTRDEPFTDLAIRLGNDVVTSLFRATSAPKVSDPQSPSLGGLVETITVNSVTPMIGEGQSPWCGTLLDITVKYNITVGDFSTIVKY